MMFSEYKIKVLDLYKAKLKEGSLPLNLMQPTPARLKRECQVALERIKKKDLKTLSDFFGPCNNPNEYLQVIRRIETDKFRPLESFLKGKVQNPDDKNIELLAWLIDFPDRPFKFGLGMLDKEYRKTEIKEGDEINHPLSDADQQKISGAGSLINSPAATVRYYVEDKPGFSSISKYKTQLLITGLILILGAIGFSINRYISGDPDTEDSKSGNTCMYWAGEQYVETACDKQIPNAMVIGFDQSRFDHFKRITQLDSISESDIGKVWYYKIKRDKIEFYTRGGTHPEFPNKHLKPMTMYMYNKYVKPFKK
jgi:hypothetical protein